MLSLRNSDTGGYYSDVKCFARFLRAVIQFIIKLGYAFLRGSPTISRIPDSLPQFSNTHGVLLLVLMVDHSRCFMSFIRSYVMASIKCPHRESLGATKSNEPTKF